MQRSGGKNRWLWLAVLFLFVFVAASAFILMGRLSSYLLDDSGAISLIPVQEFSAPDALAPNSIPLQQAELLQKQITFQTGTRLNPGNEQ